MPRTEAGREMYRVLDTLMAVMHGIATADLPENIAAAAKTTDQVKDELQRLVEKIEDEAREQEVEQWNPLVGKAIMVTRAAERERYEVLREAAESVATVYRDKKDRMKWPAMLRLIEVLDGLKGDIR